jgi:hypothetical protein
VVTPEPFPSHARQFGGRQGHAGWPYRYENEHEHEHGLISKSGSPSTLATDIANGKVTFDAGVIEAKWSDLRKIIKPMINAIRADIAALRNGVRARQRHWARPVAGCT